MGSVDDFVEYTRKMNEYVITIREQSRIKYSDAIKELAEKRLFDIDTLEKLGVFYIGEQVDMITPLYMDLLNDFGVISSVDGKIMFRDRYMFPVKDCGGNVLNLCGYTYGSDVKYLYGTAKYYDRRDDLYGLENWYIAIQAGWAVIVEGITDCVALRSIGIKNSFARCGTSKSEHVNEMLSRLKYGVIFIRDRDKAGDTTIKHWKSHRSVWVNICNGSKDIDEYINGLKNRCNREELKRNVFECIDTCVEWLKKGLCAGMGAQIAVENSYSLY